MDLNHVRRLAAPVGIALSIAFGFVVQPALAEDTFVRLAYGNPAIEVGTAPWLSAANTAGFWKEEGLDVEVLGFSGSNAVMQLVAAGEIDFGLVGASEVMNQVAAGVPIKMVASAFDHANVYPAVLEDSPIHNVEDLRGKRIGVGSMTGNTAAWTKAILNSAGIPPEDVEIIPTGHGATAFFALTNDQVDVLITNQNDYSVLEGMFGLDLRYMYDIPIIADSEFVFGFVARTEMIEQQPEVVEGLLRGIAKAIVWSKTNPQAAARGHYALFPRAVPSDMSTDEAVERGAKTILASVEISQESALSQTWGMASPEQIEHVRDLLVDLGSVKEKLPWDSYYTPQFIEAVNDFDANAIIAQAQAAK